MAISVVHTTTASSASVTIPATTAGNCLVVCVMSDNTSGAASVSGITLGANADNFAQLATVDETVGGLPSHFFDSIIWADPNCAGGQTAVVISGSNLNVAGTAGGVVVYEVSGLAGASVLDVSSTGPGNSASWSSGATATTTVASEIWIGAAVCKGSVAGPSSPWANAAPAGGFAVAGFQIVSSTGTATYSGTSTSGGWAAVVVTLKSPVNVTTSGSVALAPLAVSGSAAVPVTTSGSVALAPLHVSGSASVVVPQVVNQWAGTFAQPGAFQSMPPALQSTVIALTPATSVGGGTGTPSSGNWLFCIAGWNQSGLPAATVMDADDIHSFWRPGDVTASQWAVSPSSGNTRVNAWYTANLARVPGDVYAAPSGAMAGMSVLVVEVAGLGPWDTVTGIFANYAAAATSLNLALAAPSAQAFLLAAACGDSSAAGQAFAPGGWTALHTVTASNGTDHTCDAVLTSACITTSGSVSVNATASSATDLSGVIIGVLAHAPSPVPAGANPAWPGRIICEMAFGSGFGTPPDQMTWTAITDNAWPQTAVQRLWSWKDSGGVQYQLGALQSGQGSALLANWDGALSPAQAGAGGPWSFAVSGTPAASNYFTVTTAQAASVAAGNAFTDTSNPGSYFAVTNVGAPSGGFVNVTFAPAAAHVMASPDTVTQAVPATGTPVRIRAALGTTGGTAYNRWYVIQRYARTFPEQRDSELLLGVVPAALTDTWSVVSADCPSPYRGEVIQDAPYAWWPCDDSDGLGGVKPLKLLNAAKGNTNPLNIILSPNGAFSTYAGTTDLGGTANSAVAPTNAVYAVSQSAGWMYGDPQAGPASALSGGGPVAAQPGSAAWQMTGGNCGNPGKVGYNSGGFGWFLSCNDSGFPQLSGGVTVESWTNYTYFYTNAGVGSAQLAQPPVPLTVWEMATGTGPVAVLYLDTAGHLQLTTYSGGSPTTTAIYAGADLRAQAWFHVAAVFTSQTSVTVYVNGGLTATVTATVPSMTSAWTWFIANADMSTSGGGTTSAVQHIGNASHSHFAIYPRALPAWRVWSHYNAAATGFGAVPAPTSVAVQASTGKPWPDGSNYALASYFAGPLAFTALVTAVLGSASSGPSAEAYATVVSGNSGFWVAWTGLAPSYNVYTSQAAQAELLAAAVPVEGGAGYPNAYGAGASPPASPSASGDTASQRIERILGYGAVAPPRAIDPDALLVQAALDIGGQPAGANVDNIRQSVNCLITVDTPGNLCARSRAHLAADTPAWTLGPAALQFRADQAFSTDPQRVANVVRVTPYAPDNSTLPVITPSSASAVAVSQKQYGPRPLPVTSYLQDQAKLQAQADWLITQFGTVRRRVTTLKIDAASSPAAWSFVLGCNPGDLVSVTDTPFGAPATTGTYRVTSWDRTISFGADGQPEASLAIVADYEPSAYWS